MLNIRPLQEAIREKAKQRRDELKRTKDIRFEWSANLLERFAEEVLTMSTIGDLDQVEQAYADDADGRFRSKAEAIISDIGFTRQYVHAGMLIKDILDGEPRRPSSEKAEAEFAKMLNLPK